MTARHRQAISAYHWFGELLMALGASIPVYDISNRLQIHEVIYHPASPFAFTYKGN